MVAEAIRFGVEPVTALQMATLNPSEWFGLHERGAIAPGRVADFIVFDNLADFCVRQVYSGGKLVAQEGALLAEVARAQPSIPAAIAQSVHVDINAVSFRIPARGDTIRVIGARERQLVTDALQLPAHIVDGEAVADVARDILKMAVIERHTASGSVALGFIQGFGLQRGAIAGTVAHDHHNLVVIGADDGSMRRAAQAVAALGGGLALAEGDEIVATLPLPVAGLMSDQPVAAVRAAYDRLLDAAHARGSEMHDPFMAMSFMALEVIPTLKLTDRGLVDVERFAFVDLFVNRL
jgi:adenine deaminase